MKTPKLGDYVKDEIKREKKPGFDLGEFTEELGRQAERRNQEIADWNRDFPPKLEADLNLGTKDEPYVQTVGIWYDSGADIVTYGIKRNHGYNPHELQRFAGELLSLMDKATKPD
jgi:hypothetical protein